MLRSLYAQGMLWKSLTHDSLFGLSNASSGRSSFITISEGFRNFTWSLVRNIPWNRHIWSMAHSEQNWFMMYRICRIVRMEPIPNGLLWVYVRSKVADNCSETGSSFPWIIHKSSIVIYTFEAKEARMLSSGVHNSNGWHYICRPKSLPALSRWIWTNPLQTGFFIYKASQNRTSNLPRGTSLEGYGTVLMGTNFKR